MFTLYFLIQNLSQEPPFLLSLLGPRDSSEGKSIATKAGTWVSIPRTHTEGGEDPCKLSSDLYIYAVHVRALLTYIYTNKQINKTGKTSSSQRYIPALKKNVGMMAHDFEPSIP